MTTIEINAGGRYVKIAQDGRDAETLLPLAEQAWKATEGAQHESNGPAFGFQAERRWTAEVAAAGNSAYNRGRPPAPVTAQEPAPTLADLTRQEPTTDE